MRWLSYSKKRILHVAVGAGALRGGGRRRGVSARRNNCMFALPHELTGIGTICGLFGNACNGYGKRCLGYRAHNTESRKALAEAIAEKKKQKEESNNEKDEQK